MALRKIIEIDEELCDGCGDCITACHEGAIKLVDGKAKLISESYCDGLGDCIGECPQGAIKTVVREAADFDEQAVQTHLKKQESKPSFPMADAPAGGGCPGSAMRNLAMAAPGAGGMAVGDQPTEPSLLGHWPVQLMLVPPHAPFLKNADLLICADCVPFTVPDFHQRYLKDRAVVVGCPKLDSLEHYFEKLKDIFQTAEPRRITVLRMEVPCCGGIAQVALQAKKIVCPDTPIEVHTIGVRGEIRCESLPGKQAAAG